MKSRNCGKKCSSASDAGEMLQKMPMRRSCFVSLRTICTQRNSSTLSITPIRSGLLGRRDEFRRQDQAAVGVLQAREAFVERGLALRQLHDRLQVQVDAVFQQRFAHQIHRSARGGRIDRA